MNQRSFFAELKRRNVYKVAVAYAVVGWLLIQVATATFPVLEIPNWATKLVIVLVALGFPIALILAWAFELTPGGIQRTETVESLPKREGKHAWVYIVAVAAALSVGLFVARPYLHLGTRTARADIAHKSIAVLPFANLSRDPENAFFASGIQDEILTALAKISGLKVVSRTSTAKYQSSPQNLPEIARALGVAHILEGSVQRSGDRVHISVQLIRADTDAHVWARSYNRALTDIFAVEAEVAASIAHELQAALTPEEKARVEKKPTQNSDAYVLYLRATHYANLPGDLLDEERKAADLYEQAIALDPNFALAHAGLSTNLAHIYLDYEPTEAIGQRARAAAEEALRLEPDLGDGRHARGMCLYWIDRNYDAALQELGVALRLLPNRANIEADIAYIRRRQGRWRDALAGLERALDRDPQNASIASNYYQTLCFLRDWPAAERAAARAGAVAADSPIVRVRCAYVSLWARGDLVPLQATLQSIPADADPNGKITIARWDAALLARDYAAAERAVEACAIDKPLAFFGGIPTPKEYLHGSIALAQGDVGRAKTLLDVARVAYERETAAFPREPFRHAQLALVYAYLGRNGDAVREAERAIALRPESRDAVDGPAFPCILALVYARAGEPDKAIPLIERLLTTPAGSEPASESSITLQDLRLRWQWDPLRDDPRFQKIIAGPEPRTDANDK